MYAVVRTGGKQIRVEPGADVWVERLPGQVGETIELPDVLLVGDEGATRVGTPTVDGAVVVGTITAHGRGEKLTIFKFKRRKNYRRKQGHRQAYTRLHIDQIRG